MFSPATHLDSDQKAGIKLALYTCWQTLYSGMDSKLLLRVWSEHSHHGTALTFFLATSIPDGQVSMEENPAGQKIPLIFQLSKDQESYFTTFSGNKMRAGGRDMFNTVWQKAFADGVAE